MKKFVYILIGIVTFSIGFWIFQLRPLIVPVSLCEISQHAELYQAKQIRIKAFLDNVRITEDGRDDFSVSDLRKGCITGASLEISEQLKSKLKSEENFQNFISELRGKNDEIYKKRNGNGIFVTEVEIIGEIKKVKESEYGVVANPPPFIIEATEIRQISPIRFVGNEEIRSFSKSK